MKISPVASLAAAALAFAAHATAPDTEAVEYYNLGTKHYFVTGSASEAKLIDGGAAGPGWVRTGRSFQAWQAKAASPAGASPVCRFYSTGANSHFYTADAAECAYLKSLEEKENLHSLATGQPVMGWRYEGVAFYIEVPAGTACPAGTTAIQRVYNNGFANGEGSNHRFVDDAALGSLMADRSWIAEGTAFCARTKSSGTDANLRPTTTSFESLADTWTGTATWKVESGAAETRTAAPLTLVIAADGSVSGSGPGCAFTGQLEMGDGFRSLFSGTLSAGGCTDVSFNGDYRKFQLERFDGTLMVRMKRGADPDEASVSAALTGTSATPPPAAGAFDNLAGDWTGTVSWNAEQTANGREFTVAESNQPLSLTVSSAGDVTGSGFGCAITGALTATPSPVRFSGQLVAAGCTRDVFDGTYAQVNVVVEHGRLHLETNRHDLVAGSATNAEIEGTLFASDATGTPPPAPGPAALTGTFGGSFTARVTTRTVANGMASTASTSATSDATLTLAEGGALTGSGFGCAFSGTLAAADGESHALIGTVTATGCTDAALDGTYSAEISREDGGIEVEMEMSAEAAGVRTQVAIRGKALPAP